MHFLSLFFHPSLFFHLSLFICISSSLSLLISFPFHLYLFLCSSLSFSSHVCLFVSLLSALSFSYQWRWQWSLVQLALSVRGFCIATRPDSSFCVCARVLVLGGSDHMEDEQNKGDEEIGQDVETLERPDTRWHVDERSFYKDTCYNTWAMKCMCANECARKYACEGVLFTPPVGYSGSLSTVNETNCSKQF